MKWGELNLEKCVCEVGPKEVEAGHLHGQEQDGVDRSLEHTPHTYVEYKEYRVDLQYTPHA